MQDKEHGFYSNCNCNTLESFAFFLKCSSCYVDNKLQIRVDLKQENHS